MREKGSATREVAERALGRAGVRYRVAMELDHTEAIKQAVMAGVGIAFVSTYAVQGELATRRLASVRVRGLRIQRHFHVIQNEARTLPASARAFIGLLEETAGARSRSRARTRRN
jgi:DNA-binding transcriptional LysR family regulator